MTGTEESFWLVKALAKSGLSDYEIARRTGINRIHGASLETPGPTPHSPLGDSGSGDWEVIDLPACCYLLGSYLGDGHINHRPPGTWTLRVARDRQHERIVTKVMAAMEQTFPFRRATRFAAATGACEVVTITHRPSHAPSLSTDPAASTSAQSSVRTGSWRSCMPGNLTVSH
ncbi:MAG TPA: hypothetical protein VGF70_07950 [Solirubrobacteraceae bacterium]|jgi:hypothetical protein